MTGRRFWLSAGRNLIGRVSERPHGEAMLQREARAEDRSGGSIESRRAPRDDVEQNDSTIADWL